MPLQDQDFLFELLAAPSPTGFESAGQKKWCEFAKKHTKKVHSDAYGNAWATVKGAKKGPVIMIEAHADEIGYMVNHITAEGFLHIAPVGGSDAATARGRKVYILTDKKPVLGIIGNTAIHIRERGEEKAPKVHELYVDIGATDKEDVEKMGIRVGLPIIYADEACLLGKDLLVSRALDNRIGSYIIAQVLKRLAKKTDAMQCTLHAVNAVQEEIGGHGASMATTTLQPDLAICFDVTHSTDTPGIDKARFGDIQMHKGPTLTHGTCNHPEVVNRLMQVAKRKKIPVQHEASSNYGGTDTSVIFKIAEGIPSALLSTPLRYMHSVVETASIKDINLAIDLLEQFILSIKSNDSFVVKL